MAQSTYEQLAIEALSNEMPGGFQVRSSVLQSSCKGNVATYRMHIDYPDGTRKRATVFLHKGGGYSICTFAEFTPYPCGCGWSFPHTWQNGFLLSDMIAH